ncbi:hypothetical protein J1N35_023584 [Gossypium stocksii]|uniref:Uncharacterized protein n=1 Tax=Gossypium stocksii TaxID=47602 RepID=A0A9D3VJ30_9ROSI|nr:hypothetical protein J1N35_023584 [Gossypium stocksii]
MCIEFNWHPRILVVAQSDVALLLDFRHDEFNVICLTKIEMLSPYAIVDEDQSLAFPRVGADRFQFVLDSQSLLLLCDMHKTVVPMLRWARDLDNPCFNDVIRLISSRKFEAQRYCASWNWVQNFDVVHREPLFYFEDNLLYFSVGDEYEFPKRLQYLNFDYLRGYLNANLVKGLDARMKKSYKVCEFGQFKSSPALFVVFNDIILPNKVLFEIAKQMLGMNI